MAAAPARERAALMNIDDSVALPPTTGVHTPVGISTAGARPEATGSSSDAENSSPAGSLATADPAGDAPPAAAGLHWTVLPALPTPNHAAMRKQSTIGCAVVISTIVGCVSATHTAVWLGELESPLPTAFVAAIWAETAVALICLLGLMFGDPGTINRCEERCMPVPSGLIRTTLVRHQSFLPCPGSLPPCFPRSAHA